MQQLGAILKMFTGSLKFTGLLIVSNLIFFSGASQNEWGLFAGLSNYTGDLKPQRLSFTGLGATMGGSFLLGLSGHWQIRASATLSNISGNDKNNTGGRRPRNLSFQSQVLDGFLALQFRLFSLEERKWTPYAFGGAGLFTFNPYVNVGDKNERVFLQPLGTEGQGLPEYPDRKMYSLTQFFIPMGGGFLFRINDRWRAGLEGRLNVTFTDYLDDVSTRYPLPDVLMNGRGPLAVSLSWRRDEYDGRPFPTNEPRRGNPQNNDWFYQAGIHIGYALAKPNQTYRKGKGNQFDCPRW